jgi:signal transduction histidine kinase
MFKDLKKRLLLMNISLIIFILIIGFSGIYFTTLSKTNHDIHIELDKISNFRHDKKTESDDEKLPKPFPDKEIPERTVAFSLYIDGAGEITEVFSFFDGEESFYEEALEKINREGNVEGKITLDDARWAYKIVSDGSGKKAFFVDVTPKMEVLSLMIITFIVVAMTMVLLIIIVSSYLTNQSIKPIKVAFAKQNQFISDASHELKTPLAVIQSNVDVLMEKNTSKELEKWLGYIQGEVKRMSQLTENLLYMSKMEYSEKIHSKVNLSELCEYLLLGLEAVAYEKNLSLKYDVEESIETIGDKEQLTQLLMILLDNGMKFSPEGESVFLSLKEHYGQIEIIVENTGVSISDEKIPYIFDRFYKGDDSRKYISKSYGLGLSIAQIIVKNHKGKITCESDSNSVKFAIQIPKK